MTDTREWEARKAAALDGFASYDGVEGDGVVDALIAAGDALSARLAQHQKAWKRLPAAIRDAERFDAQHGLHIPGDSALAVVLGGIEEDAVRLGDPDEYHRIMSGTSEGRET